MQNGTDPLAAMHNRKTLGGVTFRALISEGVESLEVVET